ncbi:MAG: class I SAM-dependent methyltransferase [Nannocystaceae bacterium]|nr:class I SAM-dependent methyltransferase [Nannocystaceae bacterium]
MFSRPYDDRPIPKTHVRTLEHVGRSWGLSPVNHERASVLEVGCAHGVNLMAMAARLPGATFLGVDIDPQAIALAQARAADAKLTNVRFEVGDVQTFDVQPGMFDYAIAHGVLSWVSEAVGVALLALLSRALSPEGIAYVSFDAMPGAALRETLGIGLRGLGTDDVERIRTVLSALQAGAKRNTVQGAWLHCEVSAALSQPASFVEQQFLSPHQRALPVAEVWDEAQAHGLRYFDDVADTGMDGDAFASVAREISSLAPNRRAAEQLLDTAIHRQFRASLFTRSGLPLVRSGTEVRHAPVRVEVSQSPCVLPLSRVEARSLGFVSTPDLEHRALHPLHALLVESLDGTRTIAELEALVVDRVGRGSLSLPTESGEPATPLEAQRGASVVVARALDDLAEAGVLLPSADP